MLKKAGGKWIVRQETRLASRLVRRWKKQMAWVIEQARGLSVFKDEGKGVRRIEAKTLQDEIETIAREIPGNVEIVDEVVATARVSYKKGAQHQHKVLDLGRYGISWDIVNPDAVDYLDKLRDLNLSDYRGSISRQTKRRIQRILRDGVNDGLTYDQLAEKIREQGKAGVFSKARGRLIATNQVGHAYGEGNNRMVRRFSQQAGVPMKKAWATVNDDRVTPECRAYQEQGWIDLDANFTTTGTSDQRAPRQTNPRCRCDTRYQTSESLAEEE